MSGTPKILILDDDVDLAEGLADILEMFVVAEHRQAVRVVDRPIVPPDDLIGWQPIENDVHPARHLAGIAGNRPVNLIEIAAKLVRQRP